VTSEKYQCSPGVTLQAGVDRARRISHTLGFRPYRVWLVWQERDRKRKFNEVCRVELVPVRVIALDAVDLDLSQGGLQPDGGVSLREISPLQVTEDTLRGYLDGALWGADDPDREFFYEIQRHPRCAGEDEPRRRRFVIGAEPHHEGGALEFRVGLVDQEIARSRAGEDRSSTDEARAPRLVT